MGKMSDRILNKSVKANQVMRTFIIPRQIIESGFAGVRKSIDNIERLFREGKNNLMLMVDGYNEDPREIWEIDEVVEHLMEVTWHSPISIVLAPSSVKLLLMMKGRQDSRWFSNTENWQSDFIASQIDWVNKHYPATDEDDAILSRKPIEWSKVSETGTKNYELCGIVFEKIPYAHNSDTSSPEAILKTDAEWSKRYPDID